MMPPNKVSHIENMQRSQMDVMMIAFEGFQILPTVVFPASPLSPPRL